MSQNIEFKVKLQESTLTFVKDYELTSENGTALPQTGSAIDSTMLAGYWSCINGISWCIKQKKKKVILI